MFLPRIVIFTLLAVSMAAPAALAFPVGASGECYNADGSKGGHDKAEVDAGDPTSPPTLPTGTGVAAALLVYASRESADGCERPDCGMMGAPACGPDEEPRVDYLEAHAGDAQVCYARGSVWTNGSCPTTPSGP